MSDGLVECASGTHQRTSERRTHELSRRQTRANCERDVTGMELLESSSVNVTIEFFFSSASWLAIASRSVYASLRKVTIAELRAHYGHE